jgi:hypothetical protein
MKAEDLQKKAKNILIKWAGLMITYFSNVCVTGIKTEGYYIKNNHGNIIQKEISDVSKL